MKINNSKFTGILVLILVSVLALSACGGGSPEPDVIDQDISSHADDEDTEVTDAVPSSADDYYYIGTSLEGVDICKLIPLDEIINIVGALRESSSIVKASSRV